MVWAIAEQTIPTASFMGDDHAHLSSLSFTQDVDASLVDLTLTCEDGSAYVLRFNRNGTPQAMKKIEVPEPPPEAPEPPPEAPEPETRGRAAAGRSHHSSRE